MSESASAAAGYSGDVSARQAWEQLSGTAGAVLIDVRTKAEWVYVGVPVLADIGKETVLVEWDEFPSGDRVPDFAGRLKAELDGRGIDSQAPLYFLCRSGNRSRKAAIEATGVGYAHCFNVEHGFEGQRDPDGHRGTAGSWKAEGLPWIQS